MNCKAGDLAVLIKALHIQNIGKIVEVGDFIGDFGNFKNIWVVKCDGIIGFWAPDAWLRPVSGLLDEEDTDTECPIERSDEVPA